MLRSRLAVLLAVAALAGCRYVGGKTTGVSFFSEPPGARVVDDRRDSGFVTPCRLTLDAHEEHQVALELAGHRTAEVELVPELHHETILWSDMALTFDVWKFPLWLNFRDSVVPAKIQARLAPGHVFVRLQRGEAR